MLPLSFVNDYPCAVCDHLTTAQDVPPASLCAVSPTGDFECERIEAVARVSRLAEQVAGLIARESDRRLRAVEAGEVPDAFSGAFYALRAGLDDAAFLRACQVAPSCRACKRRTGSDGYTAVCHYCEIIEAVAV